MGATNRGRLWWGVSVAVAVVIAAAVAIAVVPRSDTAHLSDTPGKSAETTVDKATTWRIVHGDGKLGGTLETLTIADGEHGWAFGNTDAEDDKHTRIDGWDGKKWTAEKVPSGSTVPPEFADASSPTNVWAAGEVGDKTQLLHYNGKSWTPSAFDGGVLDVEAVSSTDVWALSPNASGDMGAKHFNGTTWSDAPEPSMLFPENTALTSLGPNELYAAGTSDDDMPTVEKFDGTKWTSMGVPKDVKGYCEARFDDIFARSSDDIWASGINDCSGGDGTEQEGLVAHWTGEKWDVTIDHKGGEYASLADDGAGGVWLADFYKLVHMAANGKITRLGFERAKQTQTVFVRNVPGSIKMLAAGACIYGGPPDFGAVWGYGF